MAPKRKSAEPQPEYMHSFEIHPYHGNSLSNVLTIVPIVAISSSCLPLSLLEIIDPIGFSHTGHHLESAGASTACSNSTYTVGTEARLLASCASRTQLGKYAPRAFTMDSSAFGSELGDKMLFAKIEEDSCLVLIERAGADVYMCTRLPDAVKIKHIRALDAKSLERSVKLRAVNSSGNGGRGIAVMSRDITTAETDFVEFWKSLSAGEDVHLNEASDNEKIVIEPLFMKCPPSPKPIKSSHKSDKSLVYSAIPTPGIARPTPKSSATRDLLKHLQSLYFEALYVSRTAVTFFVKTTLARFRTLCQDNSTKIIDVLQHMVLTISALNFKYKHGLPDYLSELENLHGTDEVPIIGGIYRDDGGDIMVPPPPGIASTSIGLSAQEEERTFIQRWWNIDDAVRKPKLRSRKVNDLKKRETKLQIILLLEILAQERILSKAAAAAAAAVAAVASKSSPTSAPSKTPKRTAMSTKATGLNVRVTLDVYFDHLNIWQAVSSLDYIISSPARAGNGEKEASNNEVRDFCAEIVVPYFGSRLPRETDRLLKRCAGGEEGISGKSSSSTSTPLFSKTSKSASGPTSRQGRTSASTATRPRHGLPEGAVDELGKSGLASRSSSGSGQPGALHTRRSILDFAMVASDATRRSKRKGVAVRGGLATTNQGLPRRQVEIVMGTVSRSEKK
ncbi:DNA replication regulator SLD3-domain-containing protein [Limtongia smithiae]|uniref:DNA replication regulator SLD3-domain-containing protein n=1 Tax=Limtongia smithiae TaxID=1125753 RepID=UPI0034CF667E